MRVERIGVQVAVLAAWSVLTAGAGAQVIGPANAPPPPLPSFTPRPVEPTPPSRPLPEFRPLAGPLDAVERDGQGRVLPPTLPPDYAVFEAFARSLGAEEANFRKRWEGWMRERAVFQETLVIDEIELALSLRQSLPELRTTTKLDRVQELAAIARKIMAVPPMITELTDAGRFGEEPARQLRAAVSAYRTAVNADAGDRPASTDPRVRAAEGSRRAVLLNTMEPMLMLDRLLARAGKRWETIRPTLALTPEQVQRLAPLEQKAASAASDAERADAMAELVTVLSGQQKTMLMEAVRTNLTDGPQDR